MPRFFYKVRDLNGQEHSGTIEEVNEKVLRRSIQEKGWTVLTVCPSFTPSPEVAPFASVDSIPEPQPPGTTSPTCDAPRYGMSDSTKGYIVFVIALGLLFWIGSSVWNRIEKAEQTRNDERVARREQAAAENEMKKAERARHDEEMKELMNVPGYTPPVLPFRQPTRRPVQPPVWQEPDWDEMDRRWRQNNAARAVAEEEAAKQREIDNKAMLEETYREQRRKAEEQLKEEEHERQHQAEAKRREREQRENSRIRTYLCGDCRQKYEVGKGQTPPTSDYGGICPKNKHGHRWLSSGSYIP